MKWAAPILCLALLAGSQDRRNPIVIQGPPAILVDGEGVFRLRLPTGRLPLPCDWARSGVESIYNLEALDRLHH